MDPLSFRRHLLGHGLGRRMVLLSFAGEHPPGPAGLASAAFMIEKIDVARVETDPDILVIDLTDLVYHAGNGMAADLEAWRVRNPGVELAIVSSGSTLDALQTAFASLELGFLLKRLVGSVEEGLRVTGRW